MKKYEINYWKKTFLGKKFSKSYLSSPVGFPCPSVIYDNLEDSEWDAGDKNDNWKVCVCSQKFELHLEILLLLAQTCEKKPTRGTQQVYSPYFCSLLSDRIKMT